MPLLAESPESRMAVRTSWWAVAPALCIALAGCAGDDSASPTAGPGATAAPEPSTSAPSPTASDATPSAQRFAGRDIAVTFAGGQVSGDIGRVPAALGESLTIVVTSDTADEVHLHGYDVSVPVTPGSPASLTFEATIPGVFEVELEGAGQQLLTVQVS